MTMTRTTRFALTVAATFALSVLLTAATPPQGVLPPEQNELYEKWMQFPALIKNVPSGAVWGADDRHLWYWLGVPDRPASGFRPRNQYCPPIPRYDTSACRVGVDTRP
jgi:hypothetical protein